MADEEANHGDVSSVPSSSVQNEDVEDSRDGHIAEGSTFLINTEVQPNDQVIPGSTGRGFAQASNASAGPSLKRSASHHPPIIARKVQRILPSVQASAQASPSAASSTHIALVPIQSQTSPQFLPQTVDHCPTSSWPRGTELLFRVQNPATSSQFLPRTFDYRQTRSWLCGTGLLLRVQNPSTSPQFLLRSVDYHRTSFGPHDTGLSFPVQSPATSPQFLPQTNDYLHITYLPRGPPFPRPSSSLIVTPDYFQTSSQTRNFQVPVQTDCPPPLPRESTPRISQDLNQLGAPSRGECFLCHRDLSLPTEDLIIWPILRPVTSVFPCYHHFHAECLELITLTDQSEYPPCIQCQVDKVQSSSSSPRQ